MNQQATDVLPPRQPGLSGVADRVMFACMPRLLALARERKPVFRLLGRYFVTRYDDVRTALAQDDKLAQPYGPRLDVILEGAPFLLGESDSETLCVDTDLLRTLFRLQDLPELGARVEHRARAIVESAAGRLEVVDTLTRAVAFDYLAEYLGLAADRDLQIWSTRLFNFIFFGGNKPGADVLLMAGKLRAHIDAEIMRARASTASRDDIIARGLRREVEDGRFTDRWIRAQVMGMIVGGPPQLAMALPHALNQLLKRPYALAGAQSAARAGDDAALFGYVFEALRFEPIAPAIPRRSIAGAVLAPGTPYECPIPADRQVLVGLQSAMHDPRRVADPHRFDPNRPAYDYMHFGFGLHECFGRHINRATMHRVLKPLLARSGLRRAPGASGKLKKRGAYAASMTVLFD